MTRAASAATVAGRPLCLRGHRRSLVGSRGARPASRSATVRSSDASSIGLATNCAPVTADVGAEIGDRADDDHRQVAVLGVRSQQEVQSVERAEPDRGNQQIGAVERYLPRRLLERMDQGDAITGLTERVLGDGGRSRTGVYQQNPIRHKPFWMRVPVYPGRRSSPTICTPDPARSDTQRAITVPVKRSRCTIVYRARNDGFRPRFFRTHQRRCESLSSSNERAGRHRRKSGGGARGSPPTSERSPVNAAARSPRGAT